MRLTVLFSTFPILISSINLILSRYLFWELDWTLLQFLVGFFPDLRIYTDFMAVRSWYGFGDLILFTQILKSFFLSGSDWTTILLPIVST